MDIAEEIINDVVYNLKRLTNLNDIEFESVKQQIYDYNLEINGVTFACYVKRQVTKANYNSLVQQLNNLKKSLDRPLIIAAEHFVPEVFNNLQEDGFNVIESNGNCKIIFNQLYINIGGQKTKQRKEVKGKAFNETGLKVVFYFLLDEVNINKPYRLISKETGVSLGSVKNIIADLSSSKYVITTPKGRFLKNKKELLDVWQTHYNQTLKPKLMVKEMEFVDTDSRKEWENIELPNGAYWGGEGGAYITDHFLLPELFDIYTDVPSIRLMMTKKIKFEEKGRIKVYQKFWKESKDEKVVPKILIYADLMGSGNSRCIEAAQRLIENGI